MKTIEESPSRDERNRRKPQSKYLNQKIKGKNKKEDTSATIKMAIHKNGSKFTRLKMKSFAFAI